MKSLLQNPTIKGIAFIALIFLIAFLFGSCEKEAAPWQHEERLIITPGNDSIYLFADLREPEKGWTEVNNGRIEDGALYSFTFDKDGAVIITSARGPEKVKYYVDAFDRNPKSLPIIDKNKVKKDLDEYGSFSFIFPWE